MNESMHKVGQHLNLAAHCVGPQQVSVVGPGDLEIHRGIDGRYYVLDYARLFVPEGKKHFY